MASFKAIFGFSAKELRETLSSICWDSRFWGHNSGMKNGNNNVDYEYAGFEVCTALSVALCILSCSPHILLRKLREMMRSLAVYTYY